MRRNVLARVNYTQVRSGLFELVISIPNNPIKMTIAVGLSLEEAKTAMLELNDVLKDIQEGVLDETSDSL